MIPGDSVADSKGFFRRTFCQEKTTCLRGAQHTVEQLKVKPPHLLPAWRRERPIFLAQVGMIMRSETDGSSAQKEKVIYITQSELKWVYSEPLPYWKYWGHGGLKEQSRSAEESEVQIH